MSVKERLTEFVNWLGISKSEFGRQIGVSNAFISSIRKSIQQDKIQSIASMYPNLNIEWLLTGEGEMLKNGYKNPPPESGSACEPTLSNLTTEQRLQIAENRIEDIQKQLNDLNEENKWYRQTIDKILAMREKKTASSAPAADAGCADVG